jgi:hypothetical protein
MASCCFADVRACLNSMLRNGLHSMGTPLNCGGIPERPYPVANTARAKVRSRVRGNSCRWPGPTIPPHSEQDERELPTRAKDF